MKSVFYHYFRGAIFRKNPDERGGIEMVTHVHVGFKVEAYEKLWYIDIHKGPVGSRRVIGTSPETYTSAEIWKKVSEYQLYYYNKYNNEK